MTTTNVRFAYFDAQDKKILGDFLLIDNKTFEPIGTWVKQNLTAEKELFGYDFWYQPSHNVMLSTEWGSPSKIFKGFNLDDVANGKQIKSKNQLHN